MKHASKILFLISTFYNHFGYTQQIINFFNNACTFNYYKALPVQVAYCSMQGARQFQQDTLLIGNEVVSENSDPDKVLIKTDTFLINDTMLFGVFDGDDGSDKIIKNNIEKIVKNNNGSLVSQYVAKQIKNLLPNCRSDKNSIEQCFENINQDLLKEKIAANAGTTACIVQLRNGHNHKIYNVGDSRALSIDSKTQNCNFTKDHGFTNKEEGFRVNKIRGCLLQDSKFIYKSTENVSHAAPISRGFGFKNVAFDKRLAENEPNGFMIVAPDINETNNTTFFIGSDGCFDCTKNATIVSIYSRLLQEKKSLDEIAWYILYYITLKADQDENSAISLIEKTSLQDAKDFIIQNAKTHLHDNTSFVLLNIQENQSLYFNAINKERAILLFFAFLGISCKYFLCK